MSEAAAIPREATTPAQAQAIKVYANLMNEVRVRADAVVKFASADDAFPTATKVEAAFLQLRLICELIALGCLVAHGDLKEIKASRLQKAYEADFIVKSLTRLHPNFFPVPHDVEVREEFMPGTPGYHFVPVSEGFLTKEALIRLYRRAGSVLHRGSLKALSSAQPDEDAMVDEIFQAHAKIVGLLSSHHIITRSRDFVIVCAIPEQGDVHVAFAGHIHSPNCDCSDLVLI